MNALLEKYITWSLGARITVGALLAAVGSSTVIGLLAELGAVNYALAYGARLPTEGVPYLRYAATGISFAIFLIAFGALFVLQWFLKVCLTHFTKPLKCDLGPWQSFAEMPVRTYIIRSIFPALIGTAFFMQPVSLYLFKYMSQWFVWLMFVTVTGLLMVFGRKPGWAKRFGFVAFLGCILAFFVVSFTPTLYGQALLFARQGGGLPVKLTLNCKEIEPCETNIAGQLLLKTTDYFIFRDASSQEITEIPTKIVQRTSYIGAGRWGTR